MKRLVITSGRGPAECRIALSKALAVMRTEAEGLGLSADVVEGPAPDARGPGSALVIIDGDDDGTAAFVQRWAGSVLWVAQSPVRRHHRRKNWFVGVSELAPGRGGAGGSELRAGSIRTRPTALCGRRMCRAASPWSRARNGRSIATRRWRCGVWLL